MEKAEMLSEISETASKLINAIKEGHIPSDDDKFKEDRKRLILLRCLYFGEDSKYCKLAK